MSNQPVWEFVTNLGDASPLEHGGYFVYRDATGVYPPEGEYLELRDESDDPEYYAYRFPLERCTYINGVLSDNRFHPDHPAWFAKYLSRVASAVDVPLAELIEMFCSSDPIKLAEAYRAVGDYHGFCNLDMYTLELRAREAQKRYLTMNGIKYRKPS